METYNVQELSAIIKDDSAESAEAAQDAEPRTVAQDGAGADISIQLQAQADAEVGRHCIAHCASTAVPKAQMTFHAPAFACKAATTDDSAPSVPLSLLCQECDETPFFVQMLHVTCHFTHAVQPMQTANQ